MRFSKAVLLAFLAASEPTTTAQIHQATWLVQQCNSSHQANGTLAPIFGSNGTLTIKGTIAAPGVVVLDYGANVEGHPTFRILSATGDTSGLEITYSETKTVLDRFYMVSAPSKAFELFSNTCKERRTNRLSCSYG
jgi:hypothetical protein